MAWLWVLVAGFVDGFIAIDSNPENPMDKRILWITHPWAAKLLRTLCLAGFVISVYFFATENIWFAAGAFVAFKVAALLGVITAGVRQTAPGEDFMTQTILFDHVIRETALKLKQEFPQISDNEALIHSMIAHGEKLQMSDLEIMALCKTSGSAENAIYDVCKTAFDKGARLTK